MVGSIQLGSYTPTQLSRVEFSGLEIYPSICFVFFEGGVGY